MGLNWAEDLSVGNEMIDSEHKNLIVVVNSVEHAIKTHDHAAMSKGFDLLDAYMHIHFRNEERLAAAANIAFTQINDEPLHLLKEMRHIREELEARNGIWPDELVKKYSGFLSGWMKGHILTDDMQLKPVLQTYPYDFKPD